MVRSYAVVCIIFLFGVSGCQERDSVEEAEIAAIERARRQNEEDRRAILAEQVASGDMTEDEAACDYRQGLWDDDLKRCFDADDPAVRHLPPDKSIASDVASDPLQTLR
jgi:hypothetical protein